MEPDMQCDNNFLRYRDHDESVTHATFECPPALYAWSLSGIPLSLDIFLTLNVYANMDYWLEKKNNIEDPDLDRDPYHWIIWYFWKTWNDKLFRGIDRFPLELIRHTKDECQAWFLLNVTVFITSQPLSNSNSLAICLENIFLVDGSWFSTFQFSGCR